MQKGRRYSFISSLCPNLYVSFYVLGIMATSPGFERAVLCTRCPVELSGTVSSGHQSQVLLGYLLCGSHVSSSCDWAVIAPWCVGWLPDVWVGSLDQELLWRGAGAACCVGWGGRGFAVGSEGRSSGECWGKGCMVLARLIENDRSTRPARWRVKKNDACQHFWSQRSSTRSLSPSTCHKLFKGSPSHMTQELFKLLYLSWDLERV